jgi:hypothetical protein
MDTPGVCTTAVLALDDCDGVCVSLTVAVLVTAAPLLISEAENLSARPRQTPFSGCQRGFVPVVKALWRA